MKETNYETDQIITVHPQDITDNTTEEGRSENSDSGIYVKKNITHWKSHKQTIGNEVELWSLCNCYAFSLWTCLCDVEEGCSCNPNYHILVRGIFQALCIGVVADSVMASV